MKFCFSITAIISVLLLTHTNTLAQTAIGIKGGGSLSSLSGGSSPTPLSGGYTSIQGIDAAAFVTIPITGGFSLQPEVQYASQGGEKNGIQPVYVKEIAPSGYQSDYAYLDGSFKLKLNYLFIPILAKLSIDLSNKITVYAEGGPYAALLLSAQSTESSDGTIYADQRKQVILMQTTFPDGRYDVKNSMKTLLMGLEGDAGAQYNFDNYSIFIEAGGNYGLSNIYKNMPYTHRLAALTAHIGICRYL